MSSFWNPADPTKFKLALGSSSNSIFELHIDSTKVDAAKGDTLMNGHTGEIWGLAVCPNKPLVVTGAYDQHVRLWDYSKKSFVPSKFYKGVVPPKNKIHCAAFHPSGATFAVGWSDATVDLVDVDSFKVTKVKTSHKEQVECMAFSPDGKMLATGSFDQTAGFLDLGTNKHTAFPKLHSSSILALTWSADSKYLMTNDKDCTILYWDVHNPKNRVFDTTLVDKVALVDKEWHDWTCLFGWCLQGIFQRSGDVSDVNCVHISGTAKSPYRYVATGDDLQMVNLFRYPVMEKKQASKQYGGHASHATRVRFSPDAAFLFSVGGLDCSLFQWRHVMSDAAIAANAAAEGSAVSSSPSASASAAAAGAEP
jgi:WD40 repeat protein